MEAEGARSGIWEAAIGEGRFDGWPLGLHAARLSLASTSSFFISTPSTTSSFSSFSSADFDTQSTGSFLPPQKSTSLGSLIGFHSSSQLASEQNSAMEAEKEKKTSHSGSSKSHGWWPLLGCGGSLRDGASSMPLSPTTVTIKGRRGTLTQITGEQHSHGACEQEQESSSKVKSHRNVPYKTQREAVIRRPSNRPSLRFILQQPSPTSSLSQGWVVYKGEQSNHKAWQRQTSCPSLCSRLSTSVAT